MAASQHASGVAMTVMGAVDPQSLGVTLMHEHLFLGGGSRGPGRGLRPRRLHCGSSRWRWSTSTSPVRV